MKKSKIIFLVIAGIFILAMIFATWNMAKQTTPPWERKKEILNKYKVK